MSTSQDVRTAVSPRLTRVQQQAYLRQRILDAALGAFRQSGYAAATIQQIAELAGCTRGSVYLHFGSKEALLLTVFEDHVDAQVASFRARVDQAPDAETLLQMLIETGLPPAGSRRLGVTDTAAMLDAIHHSNDDVLTKRVLLLQQATDHEFGHLLERICEFKAIKAPLPGDQLAVLALALRQGCLERSIIDPSYDVAGNLLTGLNLLLSGSPIPAHQPATSARKAQR